MFDKKLRKICSLFLSLGFLGVNANAYGDISHKKMLEVLNLKPIVDAGMRLGEGTGANLAVVVLQSAIDVYNKLSR